jgi:tetratricopeptide (TPR) repeat protein
VALYLPVQGHPWLWDDESQIADNRAVTVGAGLGAYFFDANTTTTRPDYNHGIYRPLRTIAYRALAVTFGVRPGVFEAANLMLYVVLTALVLLALLAMTGSLFAAAAATLLWALLPMHVQAVAYPSALGDLLSAVLEALALGAGLVCARRLAAAGSRAVAWGVLSTVLAAASMFAKEMAVTEPLLLALLLWLDDQRRSRALAALMGAHLMVAAGYVVTRSLVLGQVAQRPLSVAELALGLKKAPVLLVEYARLTVAPLGHRAFYSVSFGGGELALALAIIAGSAALAWRARLRPLTAGLAFFALALLPVLQLLPIIADLADRFALWPSLGLALAAAALLARLPLQKRVLGGAVVGVSALVLAGGTLLEQRMYQSDGALWRYTVDRDPEVGTSHGNLANVLLKEGRPGEALLEIDRARALGFDGPFMWVRRARALDEVGRTAEAVVVLRAALAETPREGQLHAILGDLYLRNGQPDEARHELEIAEQLAPGQAVTKNLKQKLQIR